MVNKCKQESLYYLLLKIDHRMFHNLGNQTYKRQVTKQYTETQKTPQAHDHMPAATSVSDKTTKARVGFLSNK